MRSVPKQNSFPCATIIFRVAKVVRLQTQTRQDKHSRRLAAAVGRNFVVGRLRNRDADLFRFAAQFKYDTLLGITGYFLQDIFGDNENFFVYDT